MKSDTLMKFGQLAGYTSRTFIVLTCLAICIFSFANAVANVTRDSNSVAALRFAPSDASALATKTDVLLSKPNIKPRDIFANASTARASLVGQAINPRALRQLGFVAEAKGDTVRARKLMALSTATSRRDFGAQLWLIENGVRSNNLANTLSHYDVALRTNGLSAPILYPILSAALSDATVRTSFAPYIKSAPVWLDSFLAYAQGPGAQSVAVAKTIVENGGLPATERFRPIATGLIVQLASQGAVDEARRFYITLTGANKTVTTSTRFEKATTDPQFSPVTWQLQNLSGVEAQFEPVGEGSATQLHIFANSGERASVVRKLLYLTPGNYSFSEIRKLLRFDKDAAAYWNIYCIREAQLVPIWRNDINSVNLSITPNCPAQMLDLIMAGGSDQNGAEVVIKSVSFVKR